MSIFKPHGSWHFHVEPPYLYLKVGGTLNAEGFIGYREDLDKVLTVYSKEQISHVIVDMSQWELATADILTQISDYYRQVAARGYESIDFLGASIIGKSLLTKIWPEGLNNVSYYSTGAQYFARYPERKPKKCNWW